MPLSKIDSDSLNTPITAVDLAYTGTLTGGTGIVNLGSGQVYKDASGNVGIGTSSPTASSSNKTLTLNSPATFGSLIDFKTNETLNFRIFSGGSDAVLSTKTAIPLKFETNDTERARIDSSGNVMTGLTSALGNFSINVTAGAPATSGSMSKGLTVTNTSGGRALNFGVNESGGYTYIQSAYVNSADNAQPLAFFTGPTERARIESGGSLLMTVARSTARGRIDIPDTGGTQSVPLAVSRGGDAGTMVNFFSTNSTTTTIGTIGNSGNTNTTYNTSSDYRLKENIVPMARALDTVAALKPVTWNWKSTGADGQGFIAHELAEVVPDCVTGEKDAVDGEGNPVHQGVDTSYLVATLTAAIQELKAIVDAQGAEIAALKGTP